MEYTKEQLEKKFNALPQEVREAILATDTENIVRRIGQDHALHVDQIGELMEATDFVMLGILKPGDFIRDLYERFESVDKQTVRQVAQEVNEQVFRKIRESLKRVHSIAEDEARKATVSPAGTAKAPNNLPIAPAEKVQIAEEQSRIKIQQKSAEVPIISKKLGSTRTLPKEESTYGFGDSTANGDTMPAQETNEEARDDDKGKQTGYISNQDPYREPIE
ncbi:MAG: hypothetical protein COW88_02185 [Candidatus Lloydbacteria bacterium CG22_combo_CG10-13_8_21_14_all_47_15]|uniref:HTH Mu-type domain-containing protein n=1 Tax=Candidatus Lloydbacteria bacterium CG22_combo_CG10-13_8_21_14_all_47_15 TaxID=1974635 RepID=A0A2H0CU39_9BACT|nr:MAG: hypothetical protein COW88_02185 [Candidatus Lloydbacteria bacterium CG22_combo_CG10-13_8_21_14_all_47_15]